MQTHSPTYIPTPILEMLSHLKLGLGSCKPRQPYLRSLSHTIWIWTRHQFFKMTVIPKDTVSTTAPPLVKINADLKVLFYTDTFYSHFKLDNVICDNNHGH